MATMVSAQVTRLTAAEWLYIATHPHHAFAITQAFMTSVEQTQQLFAVNGLNEESDAFRHCFWSALLARDIGYFGALRFTTAHESAADNPHREREMDLHNNRVGLLIGKAGGSDKKLARRCLAALVGGQLRLLKNGVAK